ncbi:hypothetical protein CDL15_Pgr023384 [Punica granatum]|uniref:diacylglycerol O-acyltransferase n=1 Tax=Punica granatum TaxID=22663 RepID=A0A218Y2I7_PUNGR|nr:hypothetical protein CDL15_Pgr023384 [Punica granatum]
MQVTDESGARKWKRAKVKLEDHVHVPEFPSSPLSENDDFLQGYFCRLALEPLQQSRLLWEVHMINYRMTEAAGTVVFNLHHSLGDGYSIMGALISCLSRADDPSLPLTFPTSKARTCSTRGYVGKCKLKCLRTLPRVFASVFNTPWDFGWSLLKSTCLVDDQTPIWSRQDGIEFRPLTIAAVSFSLGEIKQVKSRLRVNLSVCIISYAGKLRINVAAEKGFILYVWFQS